MQKRYPHQLSYGANNPVIALNEREAAKIFSGDTRSDIGSEAEKMQFANSINTLVVRFVRLDYDEANKWDLLVMERLYAMDYRSYEVEKRALWLDVFEDELSQLHAAGFVHRDLRRPSNIPGERFDNILLTVTGLRLIDIGISALRHQVGDKLFARYIEAELEELKIFKEFFLNR
ncbi:MAG TPA: hypothetical protein VG738_02515 [Chitinophagaceae bacterium]|nr:hypothetical protein [Chitinophagaceae bacterium]